MSDTFAFDVPAHNLMLARCPGKQPNTVLTIEVQIFTVRICEYTEPIFYERFWCFEDAEAAVSALARYMEDEAADEPVGWKRAGDRQGIRRNGQPEYEEESF